MQVGLKSFISPSQRKCWRTLRNSKSENSENSIGQFFKENIMSTLIQIDICSLCKVSFSLHLQNGVFRSMFTCLSVISWIEQNRKASLGYQM